MLRLAKEEGISVSGEVCPHHFTLTSDDTVEGDTNYKMNPPLRILALLLAQLMASMGVALYMVADMGIAPYDSVAIIIEKLTHQKIPFHKARITILQFLQGSYPERIRAFLFHQ